MVQNIDKFRAYLIFILNKHNFFIMKEKYFNKANNSSNYEFSEMEINRISSWNEALIYCDEIKQLTYPIFRSTYGRDRSNNGKALLEKVHPFEYELDKIIYRLRQLVFDK